MSDEGAYHTWNECYIIHDTDAYHLHGENSGCHRSTKQCTECSTHTTHNHDMLVLFIKSEHPAYRASDAASHLQSGTLTAGRATEQVSDKCGYKYKRGHSKGHLVA